MRVLESNLIAPVIHVQLFADLVYDSFETGSEVVVTIQAAWAYSCESDGAGQLNLLAPGCVLHRHSYQFLLLALATIPDGPVFTRIALAYCPDRRSEIDLANALTHLSLPL